MDTTPPPDAAADAPDGAGAGLFETSLHSLPLIARGKVRDNYAVGDDRILMVASDRISAFDVVMNEPIPGKGRLLTEMALFWFDKLKHIVPNHLTGDDPESVVAPDEREQVRGRSMLVKRLTPLPIEAVVRGYLAGSGWKEYQASGTVCGVPLPPGLQLASKLPAPIFTPATKAEAGHHDENIDFARASELVGAERAAEVRDVAIRLYNEAAAYALTRGIVIADTKFEFGVDEHDRLVLMDEVLTPDSSRFWPAGDVRVGSNPRSFDKQGLRNWLETLDPNGQTWNKSSPPPSLPRNVVADCAHRYRSASRALLEHSHKRHPTMLRVPGQVQRLDDQIARSGSSSERMCLRAERVAVLARLGIVEEAQHLLKSAREEVLPDADALTLAWLNIAEGLVAIQTQGGNAAMVKMRRAEAIASATGVARIDALAKASIAHLLWGDLDASGAVQLASRALEIASEEDHASRARAWLVLAEIASLSGDQVRGDAWFGLARHHSTLGGDDAAKRALNYNRASVENMLLRQRILTSGLNPRGDTPPLSHLLSTNFDAMIGIQADELLLFQRAGLLSILGHAADALALYEFCSVHPKHAWAMREQPVRLAHESWCLSRTGNFDRARSIAEQAYSQLTEKTHIDDKACVYSILGHVYSDIGDPINSASYSARGVELWAQFRKVQEGWSQLCDEASTRIVIQPLDLS